MESFNICMTSFWIGCVVTLVVCALGGCLIGCILMDSRTKKTEEPKLGEDADWWQKGEKPYGEAW